MKKLSKILSVLLCLAMLIGVVAVMVGAEESTTPTYTKVEVTSASNITAGTYLIYGLGNSSKTDANGNYCGFMTTENSTSSRLMSTQLTITGGTVATNDSNCVWNLIDAGNGGFYIQNAGNSKYLYWNKSKGGNSIYQADDTATASVWSVVSNGSAWTLQNADERQLSVNQFGSSPNFYLGFASYATNSSCTRALEFYKLNGSSSEETTEGTTEEETTESTTETTAPSGNEVTPIVDVLSAAAGNWTVQGTVTYITSNSYSYTIYIQDATGGIALYNSKSNDISGIALGDVVTGTGSYQAFNGLPELTGATYTKESTGELVAKETTIGELTTADICTYVKIVGAKVESISDDGKYVNLVQGDATISIYNAVLGDTELAAGDTVTVTMAVGCYKNLQLVNTLSSEIVVTEKASTDGGDDATEGTESTTDPSESEETTTPSESEETTAPSESEETTAPSEESTSSDVSGDTGDKTPGDTLSVFVGLLAVSTVGLAIVTSKKKEF